LHRKDGETKDAIKCYRRALELDYAQVQWRLELAGLLAEAGQVQQAVDEVKICLRVRSRHKGAEDMLARLSIMPGIVK
jgi:predicted Zn-dependent protease